MISLLINEVLGSGDNILFHIKVTASMGLEYSYKINVLEEEKI